MSAAFDIFSTRRLLIRLPWQAKERNKRPLLLFVAGLLNAAFGRWAFGSFLRVCKLLFQVSGFIETTRFSVH